jgi:hypothetical protein
VPVSHRCRFGRCDSEYEERRMGNEPRPALRAWQLLPVRLSSRPSVDAVGPRSDLVFVPQVHGEFFSSLAPCRREDPDSAACARMAVFIATRTVRSRSRSPTSRIARMARVPWARRISAASMLRSARLCCLETRPC